MKNKHFSKKSFLYIHPILLFFLLFACQNSPKEEPISKNDHSLEKILSSDTVIAEQTNLVENKIPKEVTTFIQEQMKEFRIPDLDDYIPDWQQITLIQTSTPFLEKSDFNGDGIVDYIILLLNNQNELVLFALHTKPESPGTNFDQILIANYGKLSGKIQSVLEIEEKGVWETPFETIKIDNDGIAVNLIDDSFTMLYYWNGDKYIRVFID